jgi:putative flippase GtrA
LRQLTGSTLPYVSFLAIQISIMWNFTLHSIFTFRAYRAATRGRWLINGVRNFFLYQGACLLTQLIILSVYILLTSWAGAYFLIAQLTGIGTAFVVNYYISSRYIWAIARKYAP